MGHKIYLAHDHEPVYLNSQMLNRHGLITGATGTGKTVTVKVLIEALSDLGVPTFIADVKGDVSGLHAAGQENKHIIERIERFQLKDHRFRGFPVEFWDVYGERGLPIRTTISDMGPILIGKLLDLNDTQAGIFQLMFRIADEKGLLLLDFKDLKALVEFVIEHRKELEAEYGLLSSSSLAAIMRKLLVLEDAGADLFFNEPALDLNDWMRLNHEGKGIINVLDAGKLFQSPTLYATFLLWMLSDLYESLPEVGDLDKPKMVFFFDEAHLLFKDMPKALIERIELIVKLIRSKGVSIFFITQNPKDIPDMVLSQLGNKIQHALRAYTPSEQKAVKAAAMSFRVNPEFDTAEAITELKTGEALISVIDEEGAPTIVRRALVLPPQCMMGEIPLETRLMLIQSSPLNAKYANIIDRESAYEVLMKRKELLDLEAEKAKLEKERQALEKKKQTGGRKKMTPLERSINSAMNTIGREIGKSISRGVFGVLKGKK